MSVVPQLRLNSESRFPRCVPKFQPGKLPIEFSPLTAQSLKVGTQFGPVQYTIKPDSYKKHISYWQKSTSLDLSNGNASYPFLYWALPRVLSRWYGRLNEVIAVKSTWQVLSRLEPNHQLAGHVYVSNVHTAEGLQFATFQSITTDLRDRVILAAEDTWLLLNHSDIGVLRQRILRMHNSALPAVNKHRNLGEWNLRMRYEWHHGEWKNNIHIDSYARKLGYKQALIEGPLTADLLHFLGTSESGRPEMTLQWKYGYPLYQNSALKIVKSNEGFSFIASEPHGRPVFLAIAAKLEDQK